MLISIVMLACLALFSSENVYGAQTVTVLEDNAPIRREAENEADILDYVQKGEEVRISQYPVAQNYYRIRSKTGEYGWVHRKYLQIEDASDSKMIEAKPENLRRHRAQISGGFDFFRPKDLNSVYQFNKLNYGYNISGDYMYRVLPELFIGGRIEALLKDVTTRDRATGNVYNLSLRSYPIMVGAEYLFYIKTPWELAAGAYAGVAFRTSFRSETISQSPPNEVNLVSSPPTGILQVSARRPLGRLVSLSVIVGYRYLRTTSLATDNSVNGGSVFQVGGAYPSRVIDLSGPFINGGLALHF